MPYNKITFTNRFTQVTVVYHNGFSSFTYSENFALFFPNAAVYTSDPTYNEYFKVIIEIWNRRKTAKLAEYSMFNPDLSTINVLECEVNPSTIYTFRVCSRYIV